ncbi:MAG: glutamate--tRNA ligase [Bryobacteraceae bacterium]|nr:glutamate--tRNA ligase [Bryobacteraceae bacterium]
MHRVRFAPSPTGYLHIGSARTFIFNWLFARHHGGTMILRIDDTDLERNTEESLNSIYDGLKWLGLEWDEFYRQSDRGELHARIANRIFERGMAYRDFTPASMDLEDKDKVREGPWLFHPGMRELSAEESDRRAAAGEPFVLRFRVPRDPERAVTFQDAVYGEQSKSTADIEDFALLRSNGAPTYHMASCADDIDLRITDIIRGQDHLSNTYKHVLIFEAAGAAPPRFAHLPLLVAPDGAKLSKRKHGPVVSVLTYRDAGFLPGAYINFLCLLGWSPKNDREVMTLAELKDAFTLAGVNRSNAVVNFTEEEPFDPKAVWLNAEHIRLLAIPELAGAMHPFLTSAGLYADFDQVLRVAPLVRERIKLLREAATVADFFFLDKLPPYDPAELIPQKGDALLARSVLERAHQVLETAEFNHDGLEAALRRASEELKIKTGQMFQPVRVAACGRKVAPPLFETLAVLGRDTCLRRIEEAIRKLQEVY